MIESLEGRRLLSGAGSVELKDGTLLVQGTEEADNVQFQVDPGLIHVKLNGQTSVFNSGKVKSIRIDTGAGNDRIILGKKLSIGATIFAGGGNDDVSGGAGNDTILGGNGNDDLDGREGNDYIDAQAGDDYIHDYLGRNVCHGGEGNDTGLLNAALLGSGIESRDVVSFGIIKPYSKYVTDYKPEGTGTSLFIDHGRTILEFNGLRGSSSNQVSFSDLLLRSDGQYEVRVTITAPPYGSISLADIAYFTRRWDVTPATKTGLVLSLKTVIPGSETAGVATKVIRRTSEFFLPGLNL